MSKWSKIKKGVSKVGAKIGSAEKAVEGKVKAYQAQKRQQAKRNYDYKMKDLDSKIAHQKKMKLLADKERKLAKLKKQSAPPQSSGFFGSGGMFDAPKGKGGGGDLLGGFDLGTTKQKKSKKNDDLLGLGGMF